MPYPIIVQGCTKPVVHEKPAQIILAAADNRTF